MAFLLLLKIYSRVFTSNSYIQGLNVAGKEIRHIMHMRQHKSKAFVKSFNRYYSTIQKKNMNDILTRLAGCKCISGSEAQDQGPLADHRLSRVSLHHPIFEQFLFMQSSNIPSTEFMANSTFNSRVLILKQKTKQLFQSLVVRGHPNVCQSLQLFVGSCL